MRKGEGGFFLFSVLYLPIYAIKDAGPLLGVIAILRQSFFINELMYS